MPINEIEIKGTSISFRLFQFKCDSILGIYHAIENTGDKFSIDPEGPGFHEIEHDDGMVRGFFSLVVPFEVEHLISGIVAKSLLKRIESCGFFIIPEMLFVSGATTPQKILERELAGLSGYGVSLVEFEFRQMSQLQDRLSTMRSIAIRAKGAIGREDRELRGIQHP